MELHLSQVEKATSLLFVLFSAAVFIISNSFPSGVGGTPGPALFPRFIATCIAFFAIVQFAYSIHSEREGIQLIESDHILRFAVPVLSLVTYALLLRLTGFFLTTTGFLSGMMYYSSVNRIRVGLPLGIVITAILYNVFVQFWRVPLPEGPFGIGDAISVGRLIGQIV